MKFKIIKFSSVQSLNCVQLFDTPWTAAGQASLSITNSQGLPKLMSIESVTPSNHLILCCPLLLLPSIVFQGPVFLPFHTVHGVLKARILKCFAIPFSSGSVLRIKWPKYWSFSFSMSPSNEYSGLISFGIDWFDLLTVQGTL